MDLLFPAFKCNRLGTIQKALDVCHGNLPVSSQAVKKLALGRDAPIADVLLVISDPKSYCSVLII